MAAAGLSEAVSGLADDREGAGQQRLGETRDAQLLAHLGDALGEPRLPVVGDGAALGLDGADEGVKRLAARAAPAVDLSAQGVRGPIEATGFSRTAP